MTSISKLYSDLMTSYASTLIGVGVPALSIYSSELVNAVGDNDIAMSNLKVIDKSLLGLVSAIRDESGRLIETGLPISTSIN